MLRASRRLIHPQQGGRCFSSTAPSNDPPSNESLPPPSDAANGWIGHRVFSDDKLLAAVGSTSYKSWHRSIKTGAAPDKKVRNQVAQALREWADENGAMSFAHWASPLRGSVNLLKHDAMVELAFDAPTDNKPIEYKLSGGRLLTAETDGSSFPNGGLRQTHRAAAYMSWDRTSPPFIRGDTVYLPSAFVTFNGEALDEKTPLLRSQRAVNEVGKRLLPHLHATKKEQEAGIVCNVGWEQEFFLIDVEDFEQRPDLMAAGRSVLGALPPRNQQTSANYFAQMHSRAKALMSAVQEELLALGVPLSVYHNEVAPAQHEFSPIFQRVNVAADHNVLAMEVLKSMALDFDLVALFHEKPFKGINGSGKHLNWGLNAGATGRNLFVSGNTDHEQESFMAMVSVLTRAMNLHSDLVRAGVASPGNDHRLGAHEAPPAIISLYLGDGMTKHIDAIIAGGPMAGYGKVHKTVSFGAPEMTPVETGAEDRNRTAPFPFCGNRFELRAMGAEGNISLPLTLVQAAVAESMDIMASRLEAGEKLRDVTADFFKENKRIIFNGNGYSKEWHQEAVARGLPNLRTSLQAYPVLKSAKALELLQKVKVFQPSELEARVNVAIEMHCETIMIEANVMLDMLETGYLPACARDLKNYEGAPSLAGARSQVYEQLAKKTKALSDAIDALPQGDAEKAAQYAQDIIRPIMAETRAVADEAERLIERDLFPFPSYGDMFFRPQTRATTQSSDM